MVPVPGIVPLGGGEALHSSLSLPQPLSALV